MLVRAWKAKNEKARVVAVHGMFACSDYFRKAGKVWKRMGITTYAVDLYGYGHGRIEDVKSPHFWVGELKVLADEIGKASFLGHSMGSAIVADYLRMGGRAVSAVFAAPASLVYPHPKPLLFLFKSVFRCLGDEKIDITESWPRIKEFEKESRLVMENEKCTKSFSCRNLLNFHFLQVSLWLAKPRVPKLVVACRKDKVILWHSQAVLAKLMGAELWIEDVGHRLGNTFALEDGKPNLNLLKRMGKWILETWRK